MRLCFQMFRTFLRAVGNGCVGTLQSSHCDVRTMPYYAVARGRTPGLFQSWSECEMQVKGFSGARYKKFNSEPEAREFIQQNSGGGVAGSRNLAASYSGGINDARTHPTMVSAAPARMYGTSSTSSGISKPENATSHLKKPSTSNKGKDKSFNLDGLEDPEQINEALCKHLDALESRLDVAKKNVDKIYSGSEPSRGKRTLLIDAPPAGKRRREDGSFDSDESGFVQVYTDGACSGNGQKGARAGYGVWWGEGHPLNASGPVSGRATNNCGEIQAASHACQQARDNGIQRLCVNTDSKFLIDSITKWLPGWKRNGFRTASGAAVKNAVDFQELERASHGLDVRWRYVEAHRGVRGNEEADRLARAGAAAYRS